MGANSDRSKPEIQDRLKSTDYNASLAATAPELLSRLDHNDIRDMRLWRAALHTVLGSSDPNYGFHFDFDDSYGYDEIWWKTQHGIQPPRTSGASEDISPSESNHGVSSSSVHGISIGGSYDHETAVRINASLDRLGHKAEYEKISEPIDGEVVTFLHDRHLENIWNGHRNWIEIDDFLLDPSDPNEFWQRWLKSLADGRPVNWALQRQIARIPISYWSMEGTVVAAMIRRIEGEFISERVSTAEVFSLDQETLKFVSEPPKPQNLKRLRMHLERVDAALDDVVALGGNNGLTEASLEYRIVKRLVRNYNEDPERAVFDLADVNATIARQISSQEYPDDEPIRMLQAANTSCISAICRMEPEISTEFARSYSIESRKLQQPETSLLEEAWETSISMSDTIAAQETEEDRAEILYGAIIEATEKGAHTEVENLARDFRAIVLKRQIHRLAAQARAWATVPSLAKHYDSEWSKTAGVVTRYGGIAGMLWAAVVVLGRLLGV